MHGTRLQETVKAGFSWYITSMTEFALADLFETVARAVPDRECVVQGDRRLRYGELRERVERLASWFTAQGLGQVRERAELEPWQSGQDHVALYLYNCPEYIESMLACFRARLVPCNVNYRYTVPELVSLFRDSGARALVYHAAFDTQVSELRGQLPELRVLLRVGAPDAAIAVQDYAAALAQGDPAGPNSPSTPDDLYVLYTGGTTGRPKGVLWRQADIYASAFGGSDRGGRELASLDELRERAANGGNRALPLSPLMHGAAHWVSLHALYTGDTVVLPEQVRRFDADEALATVEREQINFVTLIGDAFGRPLLDALERSSAELPTLRAIVNGGAPLGADTKRALLARLPGRMIIDAIGSSESGTQGIDLGSDANAQTGRFERIASTRVLSADRTRILAPGDPELGWLAQSGRVPLGYLGDPERTRVTFPVLDGLRWAIPGDRAYVLADGRLEVIGRDSTTINSGGEKIFAEEVEAVLKAHPAVYDVLVCSRPNPRWGQEVCAVVQLRASAAAASIEAELLAHAARELARYKLPRTFVFCDSIERSPSGKPDYAWARQQVAAVGVAEP
jgi:3-oxocholest-4-en-26-oate---CoA ligase